LTEYREYVTQSGFDGQGQPIGCGWCLAKPYLDEKRNEYFVAHYFDCITRPWPEYECPRCGAKVRKQFACGCLV